MLIQTIANSLFNKQERNDIKFNFSESVSHNYSQVDNNSIDLPVKILDSNWENINDTHLKKSYSIIKTEQMLFFINNVIKESNRINHHPKIIIENDVVKFILTTHDLNTVSHYDLTLSKIIDQIYLDSKYILRDNPEQ
jgi:pterin-4a-carbinolamine dehydratase